MSVFLESYLKESTKALETLFGRSLSKTEAGKIRKVAEEKIAKNNFPLQIVNNHKLKTINTTAEELASWMMSRDPKPVLTGQGLLFQNEFKSPITTLTAFLVSSRKVAKDKMFQLMREGLPETDPLVKSLNLQQKNWKILAVSMFGAFGEKGFVFYNPFVGPAITLTGQLIIASTLYGFETILSGNAWIKNKEELWNHVRRSIAMTSGASLEEEWGQLLEPSDKTLLDKARASLKKACASDWKSADDIEDILSSLDDPGLEALAYRGNLYDFLKHETAVWCIQTALDGEIKEAAPGSIQKTHPEGKEALDMLWKGIERWVSFDWLPTDLVKRVGEMEREVVLLSDTDSTFLHLHPWMKFLAKYFDVIDPDPTKRLTAINAIVYMLRLSSDAQMLRLTTNLGIAEERRSFINFKSEFIIKRMVLTQGKKNYISLNNYQEGVLLQTKQVDIKGLGMKKTNTPKFTQNHLKNAIEEMVLRPQNVNRVGMIKRVIELEQAVRDSLNNGNVMYCTPGSLGAVSRYKDPYTIPAVRGSLAWNLIYKDNPIREGDKINLIRMISDSDISAIIAQIEKFGKDSPEGAILTKLTDKFYGTEQELAKNGFNWLALPRETTLIPIWARELIDIETVVQSNIAPVLPILTSLDIIPIRLPNPEVYSTMIQF
jgi:DNA polymerase elongation subunit (family B)